MIKLNVAIIAATTPPCGTPSESIIHTVFARNALNIAYAKINHNEVLPPSNHIIKGITVKGNMR